MPMFNPRSRLDTSQVEDVRGRRIGGRGLAAGGGGLGLVIMLVIYLLGGNPGNLTKSSISRKPRTHPIQETGSNSNLAEVCRSGADANTPRGLPGRGFRQQHPGLLGGRIRQRNAQYTPAKTQLYSGATEGACGYATAAVGPFYCPRRREGLRGPRLSSRSCTRASARRAARSPRHTCWPTSTATMWRISPACSTRAAGSRATGPRELSVQTELMADCLAGVWARHATDTGYLTQVTDQEIAQALDAAAAVGDDRIQQETQGYVSPESWTHGSSAAAAAGAEGWPADGGYGDLFGERKLTLEPHAVVAPKCEKPHRCGGVFV